MIRSEGDFSPSDCTQFVHIYPIFPTIKVICMPAFDAHSLPAAIRQATDGLSFAVDSLGRSGDQVIRFEKRFILKISSDSQRLWREKERLDWLDGQLPAPRSICFAQKDGLTYCLRTYIDGSSLIHPRFLKNPALLIRMLGKAVALLRSLDGADCPFSSTDSTGCGFVHGDLCLPNILVNENDEIAGLIDLDHAGRGDPWYDYAWALWSLAYNLKTTRFSTALLEEIGVPFSEEKYNHYIPMEYRT